MNLYLIERTDNVDYDEYDSFVVAAYTEFEARSYANFHAVLSSPATAHLIGQAAPDVQPGVVLGSYNAG